MLKNPLVTTIKRWKTTPRNGPEAAVRAFFPPIFFDRGNYAQHDGYPQIFRRSFKML